MWCLQSQWSCVGAPRGVNVRQVVACCLAGLFVVCACVTCAPRLQGGGIGCWYGVMAIIITFICLEEEWCLCVSCRWVVVYMLCYLVGAACLVNVKLRVWAVA